MKKILSMSAAVAMTMAMGLPAMAQGVVIMPGNSKGAQQKLPTSYLGVDTAMVLPDGLGYISVSGPGLNYTRGMGGNAELMANVGGSLGLSPVGLTLGGGLGWKQQLSTSSTMAIAVDAMLGASGIGTGTFGLNGMIGLPISMGLAGGTFTIQPQATLPSLMSGTAGASVGANLGLNTPVADNWSFLLSVTPNYVLGGAFGVPIGAGFRFAPTETSAIDVTVGNVPSVSPFSGSLGLLGLTGHVGF